MDRKEPRQSVFKRLGPCSSEDTQTRGIVHSSDVHSSGSPTRREYYTERVYPLGRSKERRSSSSRKRSHKELEEGEIDDDNQILTEGLITSKIRLFNKEEELVDDTKTGREKRQSRIFKLREDHSKGGQSDAVPRLERQGWHSRRSDDKAAQLELSTHRKRVVYLESANDKPGCSFWSEEGKYKSNVHSNDGRNTSTHRRYEGRDKDHKKKSSTPPKHRGGKSRGPFRDRLTPRNSKQVFKSREKIREQTRRDLRQLASLDTGRRIAVWLASRPNCLATILEMDEMNEDDMETCLGILARACTGSTYFEHNVKLVLDAVTDSRFLTKYLPQLIMKIRFNDKIDVVRDICTLCSSIREHSPSQTVHVALVVSLLYANYDTQMKNQGDSSTEEMLNRIRELNDSCKVTLHEVRNMQKHKAVNLFRKMSVMPELDEIRINVEPALNPILKEGAYGGVDTYLDTQFRLLREDFVAPLRAAICFFSKQQRGKSSQKRVDDIRVYREVHVLMPVCGPEGVSYTIKFNISGWNPRRLSSKKILCYGSLVCLSDDSFRSARFAVVTKRDCLSRGIIDIQFQEPITDVDVYDLEYVMVESEAFFEAYRPVLKGLQQISKETLPLQVYIIEASNLVSEPQYLKDDSQAKYDLTPLFKPVSAFQALYRCASIRKIISDPTSPFHFPTHAQGVHLQSTEKTEQPEARQQGQKVSHRDVETLDYPCTANPTEIPLLMYEKWPVESATCLDESQRRAVYSALTQELAVIQGPPGTGKTYVGLKIMEVLLNKKNRKVWLGTENRGPILVVCYTNHALDQFLEGVVEFEKDVVRIGGRSRSQKLEKYNLKLVKRTKLMTMDAVDRHDKIIENRYLSEHREAVKRTIEDKVKEAFAFNEMVVGFKTLERFMTPVHKRSLQSRPGNDTAIISRWLELEEFMLTYSRSKFVTEPVRDNSPRVTHLEDVESDDERMLDEELDGTPKFTREPIGRRVTECKQGEFILEKFKNAFEIEEDSPSKKNRLEFLKFIEPHMRSSEKMCQSEVLAIHDVWNLCIEDKWRLYRYWVDAYRADCLAATSSPVEEYDRLTPAIKEIDNDLAFQILKDVKVIGMTTTGAAKWQSVLQRVGPRIIVVEEAAEVMEAHVITTLSQHCQHLILIGDHQQLKPNPTVYRLAKQYNLDISLFERLINNNFPRQTLARQHRMRPEISAIMRNHFYKDLQDDNSVLRIEDVRGVSRNMFFINHGFSEDSFDDGLKSHSSKHEADMVVALCRYLLQQGYSTSQVTILTVYTGQLLSIKSLLRDDSKLDDVRVSVVDNYQGEECDIILLSLVRSNEAGAIGFLSTPNRICVMLSRAKLGLFCIGNFDQLASKSEIWRAITNEMKQKQLLGDSLVLACSSHPNTETRVSCAADFKRVPDGGCTRPCEFRLPCGHVCTRSCHPDDRSHERFLCRKGCERELCEAKHRCPHLCCEKCPRSCERIVTKQLPRCSHSAKMKCYENPDYIDCVEKCGKKLPCGHTCRSTCGLPCAERPCTEKVLRTNLPCGHRGLMLCSDGADQCPALCLKILACGHKCPGKCSSCLGGRLHVSCRLKCGRVLVCGHKCRSPCSSNCPPCQEKCENRCIHSRCQKKCWEPCMPCQEPCKWQCRHYKCEKKCSEPCDRPPCDRTCMKRLKCGHQCIGMCGEPCPSLCRVCHKEKVTEIFFGCEDEDGTSFVELRDCNHIIEVSGLDQWMKQTDHFSSESADDSAGDEPAEELLTLSIQLKSCPKCKTPIRRSTRYGTLINRMLEDIERVKDQVIGDSDECPEKKREIRSKLIEVKRSCLFKESFVETITKPLKSNSVSRYDLNLLLNQTNLANEIVKLEKLLHVGGVVGSMSGFDEWYRQTMKNIEHVAGRLFNPSRPFRGTEQELIDFPNELRRLHLCVEACDIARAAPSDNEDLRNQMEKVRKLLFSGMLLTEESELETKELLQELRKSIGGLGVSEETKVMIVKAIGLAKGHWYKCPNGHVYAIGECGGAMQTAKCPECQADIGGARHQLATGNTVASEMDGAQYPAWSEQANLANYDPQNLQLD